MATAGDYYEVELREAHLNWGHIVILIHVI